MTWLLLALAALALAAVTFGPRLVRWATAWSRLSSLCVRSESSVGLYDSLRQARAKRSDMFAQSQPQKGSVWPSLRQRDGLPAFYDAYGRTAIDPAVIAFICEQFAHHTGREWTGRRLPGSRRVRIAQAPGLPAVPMPRVETAMIGWWDQFPVGTTRGHGPVWWDPTDDETANLLVVARPGWGKGHVVGNVLDHADASAGRWRVYVLDPEDDIEVDGHPCVRAVGLDAAAQLAALRAVEAEFDERTHLHELGQSWARIIADRGRVLVVYDEFPSIMAPPATSAVDREPRRQSQHLIAQFQSRGRKRGIHGLALAWDPRAKALGGEIRSTFGARMAGWLDAAEYPLVLRRGVPRLLSGHGHGWWAVKEADPVEIQTYDRTTGTAGDEPNPGSRTEEAPTTTVTRIYGAIGPRPRRNNP